ncbi:MAG: hypothetical protein WA701_08920 [Solirubrobacterales bacterium]|jgi:hypothetical protein
MPAAVATATLLVPSAATVAVGPVPIPIGSRPTAPIENRTRQTWAGSADDNREAGRDLPALAIAGSIDPAKLTPGQAVQVALDVAPDGASTLKGITSDQGRNGADDPAQGQGTLTGS